MREMRDPNGKPTTKQVYLICRLVCEKHGVKFPETKIEASTTIEVMKKEQKASAA